MHITKKKKPSNQNKILKKYIHNSTSQGDLFFYILTL